MINHVVVASDELREVNALVRPLVQQGVQRRGARGDFERSVVEPRMLAAHGIASDFEGRKQEEQ